MCFVQNKIISPEAQELIATKAFHREGLKRLAACLPAGEEELHLALVTAAEAADPAAFQMLFAAAALGGRKLAATLLTPARLMQTAAWHLAWIAWRMDGNVTEELLSALESVELGTDDERMLCLFVAAAWWRKHRPGEELPKQIPRLALHLGKQKDLGLRARIHLRQLGILIGGEAMAREAARMKVRLTPVQQGRELARMFTLLDGPLERFIPERAIHQYRGSLPMRRAVEAIGRNETCPCGSGRKYKKCCEARDRLRLRRSSSVPGVTKEELLEDENALLTEARMLAMGVGDVLRFPLERVPPEMEEKFLVGLVVLKKYEEVIAGMRHFGMSDRLHSVWSYMFDFATKSWRPDIARELMKVFPDASEKLGVEPHAGIRLLLVGDDPARAMRELEETIEAILRSRDLEELQRLIRVLVDSPYRGFGIMLGRSSLPLLNEEDATGVFEAMLDARAKLNLPPEDEFGDWMDERALRKARQHETAAAQEAQDRLEAKMKELRIAIEQRTLAERDLVLHRRQERRIDEETKNEPVPVLKSARERELEAKIKCLSALVTQRGEEKLTLRRELEANTRQNETVKSGAVASEGAKPEEAGESEAFEAVGNQPVRLLEFPRGFMETLRGFPKHVGRATMNRLGRLASGEPSAFDRIKQLKAYPTVLRARISDKHRLLFCLEPDRIRVVDLIQRADLDRRIERLKAGGLPPVG